MCRKQWDVWTHRIFLFYRLRPGIITGGDMIWILARIRESIMLSISKHEEALPQMSEIQIDFCFGHDCKLQFVLLKQVGSCKISHADCFFFTRLDKAREYLQDAYQPFPVWYKWKKIHTQTFMFRTISVVRIEIRTNSRHSQRSVLQVSKKPLFILPTRRWNAQR